MFKYYIKFSNIFKKAKSQLNVLLKLKITQLRVLSVCPTVSTIYIMYIICKILYI